MCWCWGLDTWFWIIFMIIGATVAVGVVALLVTVFVRAGADSRRAPLEIAKRRYESGEISAEEFERIRRDLGDG